MLRRQTFCLLGSLLLFCSGCFHQRSFPLRAVDQRAFQLAASVAPRQTAAVAWLATVHPRLRHLLPEDGAGTLLTGDLERNGRPIDVYAHFGLDQEYLNSVLYNLIGLMNTANVTQRGTSLEQAPPRWKGFQDIWVPVAPDLELAGRLGLARADGRVRRADCIVLIPGLLGDNGLWRTRDIAYALRDSGLHVLALELRGYGQTEVRYPDHNYCYGIREVGDLLAVSEWLEEQPHVRRTGLIGFSWGANEALLAAWEDGRAADDPHVAPRLTTLQRPRNARRHFQAGVIAFSPVIGFEELVEKLKQNWSLLADPVLNRMQAGLRARWGRKEGGAGSGDLGELVKLELRRAGLTYPGGLDDATRYLRLIGPPGQRQIGKLRAARIPVLVVQAANDPLGSAQRVADLLAGLRNPNVAGVILPGGGHNGFAAYDRAYFYGLILNFFGEDTGSGTGVVTR